MTSATSRLVYVGAGRIATAQVEALERIPGVDVVGAVDPSRPTLTFRGEPIRMADTLGSLLDLDPTAVVVATPSPDHAPVVHRLLDAGWHGPTLVEKPLATTNSDVRSLHGRLDHTNAAVTCLYHARFAPELLWAIELRRSSKIRAVEMSFNDPYGGRDDSKRRETLVGPWLDSGINALSVLDWWLPVDRLHVNSVDVLDDGLSYRVVASHDEAVEDVEIWVSWKVTSASKWSRIEFTSGETLVLDHQATAGRLRQKQALVASFACDDGVPRLTRHYVELFGRLASRGWRGERDLDRRLHDALFMTERQPPD